MQINGKSAEGKRHAFEYGQRIARQSGTDLDPAATADHHMIRLREKGVSFRNVAQYREEWIKGFQNG